MTTPDCVISKAGGVEIYQQRARVVFEEAAKSGPIEAWAWVYTSCGEWCLNAQHMLVRSPRTIAYPPGVCVYCGFPAGTRDHLLPRTITSEARRQYVAVVPACAECNSLIGTFDSPSIADRRRVAHERLAKRKRATIAAIDFTPAELAEYGPKMRDYLEQGMVQKRATLARLAWPEDPFYDLAAWQRSGINDPVALGIIDNPLERAA